MGVWHLVRPRPRPARCDSGPASRGIAAAALLLAGCGHSAPFTTPVETPLAPAATGQDLRLTYNPGIDYSPSWSSDGRGVLYVYSAPGQANDDRCIGLIPMAGGPQLWSFCDSRQAEADSGTSFGGIALDAQGRLLYYEMFSPVSPLLRRQTVAPDHYVLYLADSASPVTRHPLATFPSVIDGTVVSWLADLSWTAPDAFIGLAENLSIVANGQFLFDTVLTGLAVVRGTITGTSVVLHMVPGTRGAAVFSLAGGGTTAVFSTSGLAIESVPVDGGTPSTVTTLPNDPTRDLLDVTCGISVCVVLSSELAQLEPDDSTLVPTWTLWTAPLAGGAPTPARVSMLPIGTPRLAPGSNDLLVEEYDAGGNLDIHVLKGIIP